MGSKYNWVCPNKECGVEIQNISGGYDRGFIAKTQSRICTSCKHVQDYKIGVVSDPTHQVFTEGELDEHRNTDPVCDRCGNKTKPWKLECPRCGSTMKRGTRMLLWD